MFHDATFSINIKITNTTKYFILHKCKKGTSMICTSSDNFLIKDLFVLTSLFILQDIFCVRQDYIPLFQH